MPATSIRPMARAAINPQRPAALRAQDGSNVPLVGVSAVGRLEGLVFELTVEQRYRNHSARNLEAVFTFPLPLRAVLLGFELEVGERKLVAHAVARAAASEQYERAIDDGNTAALIEQQGNGLYTVNLGNLMAGESAVIRYRYAELLDAHDGYVRLNVPTVIAPRYGGPQCAGLEGPAVPAADLLGEYPFEIRLDLVGLADVASVRSPTHEITTTLCNESIAVTLTRTGFLDRDFVLELARAAIPAQALVAQDGDGYVALASVTLGLDALEERPVALKVLLDCSGSMGGDSIDAAKRALLGALDRLTPHDRISLARFGSSVEQVTEGLEPADPQTLRLLKALVQQIDANMGGTDMAPALEATLSLATPRGVQADVILITDGEVYDVAGVLGRAAKSNHRLFVIAIGAAPNEALARSVAETTRGGCEFVGPSEDAEAVILRTFKRLRSTPRTVVDVHWPLPPRWTTPMPSAVFPGDTLHVLAGFPAPPAGAVALEVRDAAGQGVAIHQVLAARTTPGDLLPRLASARRLATLDEAAARDLAIQYQLASAHTSFVVVVKREEEEQAHDSPATVAVPHMLAAGWGGSASIRPGMKTKAGYTGAQPDVAYGRGPSMDDYYLDTPAFLHTSKDVPAHVFGRSERLTLLKSLRAAHERGDARPATLGDLAAAHPLPPPLLAVLRQIAESTGQGEREVLRVFLALLAEDEAAAGFDRSFRSALRGSIFGSRVHRELRALLMQEIFR